MRFWRALLVALLFAAPGAARADGRCRGHGHGRCPGGSFATTIFKVVGTGCGGTFVPSAGSIAVSRTLNTDGALCPESGVWVSAPVNTVAVTRQGAQIWGSTQNLLAGKTAFSSWTATGTGVAAPGVTANYANDPAGAATATRVQPAAIAVAGNRSILNTAAPQNNAVYTFSAFIKGNLGDTGTTYVEVGDNTMWFEATTLYDTMWHRVYATGTLSTIANVVAIGNDGLATTGQLIPQPARDLVAVWPQFEAGGAPGPYYPPGTAHQGTTVTGTFTNTNLAPCVSVRATPSGNWTLGVSRALWDITSNLINKNAAQLQVASNNTVTAQVFDNSGTFKVYITPAVDSGTDERLIQFCPGPPGSISINGVAQPITIIGAGTGIMSVAPTKITIGALLTPATYWNGYIQAVRICGGTGSPASCSL